MNRSKTVQILITAKTAFLETSYLQNYRCYECGIGVKWKVLKSSTTSSTVAKFIKATKIV